MPNEFIIKNGFRSQGNSQITGSLNVLGAASIIQSDNDGYLQIGNNNGGFTVGNYNRTDVKLKANAVMTSRGTGITFRTTVGEPLNGIPLGVIGSGTTSATAALLVQNANLSSSLAILDNGFVGIGTGTPAATLDVSGSVRISGTITLANTSGTNRSTDVRTSNSSDNFPTTTLYPTSGTDVGQNFQIIPRGTGLSANIKAQWVVCGTDLIADGTNFEAMVGRATGTSFTFATGKGGTGTIRPLLFSSGFLDTVTNPNQFWLYSSGNVGINTTTDAGFRLDVNGDARISGTTYIGNDGAGSAQLYTGGNILYIAGNNNHDIKMPGVYIVRSGAGYGVGIEATGFATVNSTALLTITSTTKGFLPPRMTRAQRLAISSPAVGLIVYETGSATSEGIWLNETPGWQQLLTNTGIQSITGSLAISSSAGTGSAIYAYKSGSTVLDIQGSQGQLFSVVDALSGSLMSVNDVSGLPILEVFSDDRIVMGTYGAPALIVTGSNTIISGSLRGRVVTLSTASATASMDCSLSNFFDLTLSGSMYLNVSNIQPGETINLRITQPATSGSLNYTSSIKFPNGLPYSASATSSVVDLISFISFDSSTLYATSLKNLI